MENCYIITVDENGEPYLEHAWLRRGQAHKYIMKIGDGLKARYFYTQAEVDAYMNQGKRTVQKAKNSVDNTKQKLISNVNDTYKKRFDVPAIDRRGSTYTDNYIDRAEKTQKKADEYAKNHNGKRDSALDLVAKNAKEDLEKAKKEKNKFERSVKSTSDRIKEEFKKTRENAKDEAYAAISRLSGDKVFPEGPDDKSTQKEREIENGKSIVNKYADKAENASNKMKSAAQRLNENTKSKIDKMREEFRKNADSVKETVSDAVTDVKSKALDKKADKLQKKADDLKGQRNASQQEKALAQIEANNAKIKALEEDAKASEHRTNKSSIDKLKKQNEDLKDVADGNEIREEVINEKEIKENVVRDSSRKTEFSKYTKGDPDFDDNNFREEDRIGDTDFFSYRRPDGTNVIVEEDMKWVLPKGVDAHDPEIRKAITQFGDHVESARAIGKPVYTSEEWERDATKAISDAAEKALSKYPDPSKLKRTSSEKQSNQKKNEDPATIINNKVHEIINKQRDLEKDIDAAFRNFQLAYDEYGSGSQEVKKAQDEWQNLLKTYKGLSDQIDTLEETKKQNK